jgi:HMG (high mobility group) box
MGREGNSYTETFKTEAELLKWVKQTQKENDSELETPNTTMDCGRDGYGSVEVRKVSNISGKSREKCIAELIEKSEKELADTGDDTMVIMYCQIDPTEPSEDVCRSLQYQAEKVGKAFAATVNHAKYRRVKRGPKDQKEEFIQCSNCGSQFAVEYFRDQESKGHCNICQFKGDNVPEYGVFYNDLGNVSDNFGRIASLTFDEKTNEFSDKKGTVRDITDTKDSKDSKKSKKPKADTKKDAQMRKRKYETQKSRVSVQNYNSKPLFVDSYEKSVQKARDETQKYADLEQELTADPSKAKDMKKRKREKSIKIPVKKGKSAYQFFLSAEKAKSANSDLKLGELQKKCSPMWKALSEDDKKPFEKLAEKAKKTYEKEVASFQKNNKAEFDQFEKEKKKAKKEKEETNKKWIVSVEALSGHF